MSSGRTYSAKDVWGKEIVYLQAKACESDKLSSNYCKKTKFTNKQLKNKFTPEKENIKAISSCKILSSGLVESALVFGEKISGSEIRSVLNLPSQNFEIEYKNAEYTITTYGYGHGVGMSQNGANYMAKQGYSYKKILNHFYSNINLIQN